MNERKTFLLGRDVMSGHRHPRVVITEYDDGDDVCYYPDDQIMIARDGKRLMVEWMEHVHLWVVWEEA